MNKTYAITDLHGVWNLWEQISNYCDETDTIYFLGDAIDRGADGLKIMESLLKDKRVTYLLGNHEEIFLEVAPRLIGQNEEYILSTKDDDFNMWMCNGGYETMKAFVHLTKEEQEWFLNKVSELEDLTIYFNKYNKFIYLCHAGGDLDYNEDDIILFGEQSYTWNRSHFYNPWPEKGFEKFYVVHGHTPVQYLWKYNIARLSFRRKCPSLPNIANYADGHKFDLDLGSFDTRTAALFDLDKLKVVKYFETKEG